MKKQISLLVLALLCSCPNIDAQIFMPPNAIDANALIQDFSRRLGCVDSPYRSKPEYHHYYLMAASAETYKESEDKYVLIMHYVCRCCKGIGTCPVCNGCGGRMAYSWGTSYWQPCPTCCGSKICRYCGGNGIIDGDPTSSPVPYTREFVERAYNAAYASTSTSSYGSSSNQDIEGVEVIVDAPNYTGETHYVWCEKCNKYTRPHAHIIKR